MREEKYICEECGLICKFRSDLEDHIQKEHKKYHQDIKNKKECIFWNRGFCKKGSYCTFKHSNYESQNDNIIYCKFKDNCKFFGNNICSYKHPQPCWDFDSCTNKDCKFQHQFQWKDFQNYRHQQMR